MPIYRGSTPVTPVRDVPLSRVYRGDKLVWQSLPVVTITGTSSTQSRDQFRQACVDYGTTYESVEVLPFRLDISQATNMTTMFNHCGALTQLPDMYTSHVTNMNGMFNNCGALTDGNVRLIGKHPNVTTLLMITGSGLTREPFYDTNGNPI